MSLPTTATRQQLEDLQLEIVFALSEVRGKIAQLLRQQPLPKELPADTDALMAAVGVIPHHLIYLYCVCDRTCQDCAGAEERDSYEVFRSEVFPRLKQQEAA